MQKQKRFVHRYKKSVLDGEMVKWRYGKGIYEWDIAVNLHDDPFNPTTVYAYKVRDRNGVEHWILALYPKGCPESACALYIHTEATDEDVKDWMKKLLEMYLENGGFTEEFFDELSNSDMYVMETDELEEYGF